MFVTNSRIKSKIKSWTKNFAKLARGYISLVQDSLISKPTRSIWFGQIQFSEKLFSSSWKQFLKTRMRLRRSIFLDKLKACLQKTWLLAYWLPIRLMTWWSLLSTSLSWLMSQVAWTSWCRILTTHRSRDTRPRRWWYRQWKWLQPWRHHRLGCQSLARCHHVVIVSPGEDVCSQMTWLSPRSSPSALTIFLINTKSS